MTVRVLIAQRYAHRRWPGKPNRQLWITACGAACRGALRRLHAAGFIRMVGASLLIIAARCRGGSALSGITAL